MAILSRCRQHDAFFRPRKVQASLACLRLPRSLLGRVCASFDPVQTLRQHSLPSDSARLCRPCSRLVPEMLSELADAQLQVCSAKSQGKSRRREQRPDESSYLARSLASFWSNSTDCFAVSAGDFNRLPRAYCLMGATALAEQSIFFIELCSSSTCWNTGFHVIIKSLSASKRD